jgi:23S rRNA pseudouridine1911/1915/1917 synthase
VSTYSIVHRDDALVVVDKAPGVLTVSHGGSGRCLLDDLRRDGLAVAPVHRLDRDTSGLLLLCLDKRHRKALEDAFRKRAVEKDYLALVRGRPRPPRGTIDVPILDAGATARVDRRGRPAITHYEVLETLAGAAGTGALVRARPETGRHNQIRVHLAHIGHPLWGDDKFGRRSRGGPRLASRAMLHAERLALHHPATGKHVEFRADPPADFQECLAALRAD